MGLQAFPHLRARTPIAKESRAMQLSLEFLAPSVLTCHSTNISPMPLAMGTKLTASTPLIQSSSRSYVIFNSKVKNVLWLGFNYRFI